VAKIQGLIEPDGRRQLSIGFQVETSHAGSAGFRDYFLKKPPSNTHSLAGFRHRHLRHFEFVFAHGEQGAAADRFPVPNSEENSSAAL